MELWVNILSFGVLAALVVTMLFVTKAIKAKDDPTIKKESLTKAAFAIVAYLLLNMLRLYAEGQLG